MENKFSVEKFFRVYNDKTGDYIEVCPDADGLGLIEIRQCNRNGGIGERITLEAECAALIAEGLRQAAANIQSHKEAP